MTTSENRVLDTAIRNGYIVCRRDQRTLLDQYTSICLEQGLPSLRVERHAQQSQVVLQWHQGLPILKEAQQEQLRRLLHGPERASGLLPIVFRYGAYSAFLELEAAEQLAASIAAWIQEQSFTFSH